MEEQKGVTTLADEIAPDASDEKLPAIERITTLDSDDKSKFAAARTSIDR